MRPDALSRTLLAARRRFFERGKPEERHPPSRIDALVSEPILRSWQRCAERGLDNSVLPRLEPLTAHEFREAAERHERLRRLCRPELEALYADAMQTGCVVLLTDADGLILDALGNADFAARAAQVALRPGVVWGETSTGTNAVGTALVEGRPIAVHGGEHYYDPHGILSCSAAPILDPYGRTIGALDLSGPAAVDHRHALGLVRLAVEQIEHRFFDEDFSGRRVLRFQRDRAMLGTAREGILVFEDDRLVAANRHGLALVGADWSALGMSRVGDLFSRMPGGAGDGTLVDIAGRPLFSRLDGVSGQQAPARRLPATVPGVEEAPLLLREEDRKAVQRALRMVEANVPVLVQGETGTGKEMVANDIHHRSERAGGPFVAVNCAAIPETLIEAELFGYVEGAFTGARRNGRKGLLREADGGVLFLDEIGDMPLFLQTRLLRVLQEREVAPLGGGRPVRVDFALICATHRDLAALVEEGTFRSDLYFRVAHYTIQLPPVRALPERLVTIREMWRRVAGDDRLTLSPECERRLAAHDWPGNFRQLVGTLRMLAALALPHEPVEEDMLPAELAADRPRFSGAAHRVPQEAVAVPAAGKLSGTARLGDVTREAMRQALEACGGNVSKAARQLGVNRSTLYRRLLSEG